MPDPVSDENSQNRDAFERGPAKGMPERVEPGDLPGGAGVTGEVPDSILNQIIADLADRVSAATADIQVIRAEEVIWNDGSLGCPQPGVFYTQALVDGYWVILEYQGVEYDYRAAASGFFTLCENGLAPIPPPGAPDS